MSRKKCKENKQLFDQSPTLGRRLGWESVYAHNHEDFGNLPMHHRDPVDRMLIAQAQAEGLVLVTRDALIPLYGIRVMAA